MAHKMSFHILWNDSYLLLHSSVNRSRDLVKNPIKCRKLNALLALKQIREEAKRGYEERQMYK